MDFVSSLATNGLGLSSDAVSPLIVVLENGHKNVAEEFTWLARGVSDGSVLLWRECERVGGDRSEPPDARQAWQSGSLAGWLEPRRASTMVVVVEV